MIKSFLFLSLFFGLFVFFSKNDGTSSTEGEIDFQAVYDGTDNTDLSIGHGVRLPDLIANSVVYKKVKREFSSSNEEVELPMNFLAPQGRENTSSKGNMLFYIVSGSIALSVVICICLGIIIAYVICYRRKFPKETKEYLSKRKEILAKINKNRVSKGNDATVYKKY